MKKWVVSALLLFFSFSWSQAQTIRNVHLYGEVIRADSFFTIGVFGYTDSIGREFALLGTGTATLIYNVDDSLNIYLCDSVPGNHSAWREMVVIGHYAYIVTEGTGADSGLKVIDLSPLPDSVIEIGDFPLFNTAHTIARDMYADSPFVYVNGADYADGVHIIDVRDPASPVEVAEYSPAYAHDICVIGDTMYMAAFSDAYLDIVDISDKSAPVRIGQYFYAAGGIHSVSATPDHQYAFTCEEMPNTPAKMLNVSDLSSIDLEYSYLAETPSVTHNPYIKGNFCYVTHQNGGLRILDITNPEVPVETGVYDTWLSGTLLSAVTSAYVWLPSGKILVSDLWEGLKVFRFNGALAGRYFGMVTDSATGLPIPGATVEILETGVNTLSDAGGNYRFGDLPSDSAGYTLRASAPGYYARTVPAGVLAAGDSLVFNFELPSDPTHLQSETDDFSVSPNPFQDVLHIYSPTPFSGSVELLDMNGRVVEEVAVTGQMQVSINAAHLPAGIYLLEIKMDGSNLHQKVIRF